MSKIQDALNKIRSNEYEKRGGNNAVSETGMPIRRDTRPVEVQANIHSMKEPVVRTSQELASRRLLDVAMPDKRVLNAFRELRTTILRNLKSTDSVILVTSAIRDAGASFVATNLAAAFALDEGKTSLLVSCDLRRSTIDDLAIHDKQLSGLRDYLSKPNVDVADIIYPTGIPRLRILPAGEAGVPLGEYFTSARLRDLMAEVRQRYPERYIFLDAPPVSESPDARILADVCDHVILVVPYGKTTEAQVNAAIEGIGEDKLLGVVFNNSPQPPRLRW